MYEPMLDCRCKVETDGHDGGLVRCCGMERCRWSPRERGADLRSADRLHPRASSLARRSHHRTNPHCHLRTHPEKGRPPDRF